MPRLIKTRVEVEGRWTEEHVVVEGKDLKPWAEGKGIVGSPLSRVDGLERALGRALYTQDITLPGMWHVRILRSPHAHARLTSISAEDALRFPGVHGVLTHENAPKIPWYVDSFLFDPHLRYAGEEVAAVLAETPEQAEAALSAILVEYDVLPAVTDPEEALKPSAPQLRDRGNRAGDASIYERGNVETALASAEVRLDATFMTAGALHNALETHGSLAVWEGDQLTLWDSTQYIFGIREGMARKLDLPLSKVRVIKNYMGGGFGAKNSVRKYMVIAAVFARQCGRPVSAVMDRLEENLCVGHRHETVTYVKLGATKSGRLTAIHAATFAATGGHGSGMMPVAGPFRELYECPNVKTEEHGAQVNLGPQAAFRAPGYVEGTFALESAVDMLALRLGVDPVKLRRANIPRIDPVQKMPYTRPVFKKLLDLGLKRLKTWPKLVPVDGDLLRGRGMAASIWGVGGGPPAQAAVHVQMDGTIQVFAGTQDLGTGTKTVLTQVAAEEFGIPMDRVTVTLGDTGTCPYGPASWGSMTVASVTPAVRLAARDARSQVEALWAQVFGKKSNARSARPLTAETLSELGQTIGNFTIIGKGSRFPNPAGKRVVGFAAQFVQVAVDVVTGEVRVERALCVHDCGRVLNPLLARSQVEGGFIQGMGFALMEGRRIDPVTHRVLNPSLLDYKVPTVRDIPEIETIFLGGADLRANNTGALGVGEPPVIPAAAAIANAIFKATGVRLTRTPFTPKRVLDGLALQSKPANSDKSMKETGAPATRRRR